MCASILRTANGYEGTEADDLNSIAAESDDATLVLTAQSNPEAFSALYKRYLARVYRYMRFRTATEEDAADLTQQVFLRAFDRLGRYYERGAPFSAWLFRIAGNLVSDAHRRHKPTIAWEQVAPEALRDPTDVEAAVMRSEASSCLHGLLSGLPDDKRELLALRFAGGLTAREIGHVVGKSEAAVHKQINRTLNALKEQYKEECGER